MARSSLGPGRNDPKREPDSIIVEGAREHNLVVDRLELPKHRLVVITGPSGSGKSSLAFDTLYAEGQRRYVESLSAYARQFLGQMEKPKYERIRGLSPTIAIQQKSASSNPRSTVGTITEIYDYLRVLYARAGEQRCYQCGGPVGARTASEIVDELAGLPDKTAVTVLAPKAENRKGEFRELFVELRKAGFVRVRIDGMIVRLDDVDALEKQKKHSIELVIDRITINAKRQGPPHRLRRDRAPRGQGQAHGRGAGREDPARLLGGERVPDVRHRLPRAVAAELLVQLAARHVRRVQRPRRSARRRSRSRRSRPDAVDPRRRGRGVGRGDREGHAAGRRTSSRRSRRRSRSISTSRGTSSARSSATCCCTAPATSASTSTWEGRHSTGEWAMRFEGILAQLERRHRESIERSHEAALRAVLPRDPVRGLQRHAPAARVARGVRQREADRRGHRHDGAPGVRVHHRR